MVLTGLLDRAADRARAALHLHRRAARVVALVVHLASRDWQRAKEIGGALVAVGAISVYWLIPALLFHPESLPVTNCGPQRISDDL